MKKYVHIVTVTVIAPKGYKPRKQNIKALILSEKASYKQQAEQNVLKAVEKSYEESECRKIGLKFRVESATTPVHLIMMEKDEDTLKVTIPVDIVP